MAKKPKTFIEKYEAIQAIGYEVEVPWEINRIFPCHEGRKLLTLEVLGNQVSMGEDYVSLQEARSALEWLVNQFGGKVSWDGGKNE